MATRGGSRGGEDGRKKRGRGGHGAGTGPVQRALGATAGETTGDGGQRERRGGAVATEIGLAGGDRGEENRYQRGDI